MLPLVSEALLLRPEEALLHIGENRMVCPLFVVLLVPALPLPICRLLT